MMVPVHGGAPLLAEAVLEIWSIPFLLPCVCNGKSITVCITSVIFFFSL